MPIFEYKCSQCGHVTEVLEKANRRTIHPCEQCGSPKTEKQFSVFGSGRERSSGSACSTARTGFS